MVKNWDVWLPTKTRCKIRQKYRITVTDITLSLTEEEEVWENILQDHVSENIHSKAGDFKYIMMEIPL